jgi:hypothetical protein
MKVNMGLAGIAGAAMLFMIPATPADAFAVRYAAGLVTDQTNVEPVQYRRYRYGYRHPYRYRYGHRYPYRYGYRPYGYYGYPYYGAPYAYGPYYGPLFGIRLGPIGFGFW